MDRKKIILFFLAVIIAIGALIALSREEPSENILPESGILLCEIEGEPYYYDAEYLFKVIGSVFPAEPSATEKELAIFYELAYRESVASDAYVSSDRMEQELKIRKNNGKAAEDILADPESSEEELRMSREYLAMLNTCAEKEGTTPNVFWDDVEPYVEKGIVIAMYTSPILDEFMAGDDWDMAEYETYLLENLAPLSEKYKVELIDEE